MISRNIGNIFFQKNTIVILLKWIFTTRVKINSGTNLDSFKNKSVRQSTRATK